MNENNYEISVEFSLTEEAGLLSFSLGSSEEITSFNIVTSGGIVPSGNIEITNTAQVDVTEYATAQVYDPNLNAQNIKKNISILGVIGEYELPTGIYSISTNISNGYANGAEYIGVNTTYNTSTARVIIQPSEFYKLPSSISVSNASYEYNAETGVIELSNARGNVVITAECIREYEYYQVGESLTILLAPYIQNGNEVTII